MIIQTILGNIFQDKLAWQDYAIDYLELDWYELNKRVMRKSTKKNLDIGISITQDKVNFQEGDILFIHEQNLIVISVKSCECIAIIMHDYLDIARVCYEIGNKHSQIFIDEHDLSIFLIPYDLPILNMLTKMNITTKIVNARLIKPLVYKDHNQFIVHSH